MKLKEECLFIVPRSLKVCDSRGLQFVAKICHKCSQPGALATRQNLKKKIASPARDKNRSCSRGFSCTQCNIRSTYDSVTHLAGQFLPVLLKIGTQCVHVWALLLPPKLNHTCIASPQPFPDTPPLLCALYSSPTHQNVFI